MKSLELPIGTSARQKNAFNAKTRHEPLMRRSQRWSWKRENDKEGMSMPLMWEGKEGADYFNSRALDSSSS